MAVFDQCHSSVDGRDGQIGMKPRSIDFVSIRLIAECSERGSLVAAASTSAYSKALDMKDSFLES